MDDTGNPGDIVSRADAFIKRRRAMLEGSAGSVDEDIPVLTDVVADFAAEEVARQTQMATLRVEIAREVETWLDENLPRVVVHALDGIADQLIGRIHQSAREELLPRLQNKLPDGGKPD